MSHPSPKRNMFPKAVLMRSGLVSLTTARPVNTAQPKTTVNSARPMKNVFNKAHSTVRRPINNKTTTKTSNFNQRVNSVKDINVNATRPKVVVNTAKPKAVLNAVKENQGNPQIDLQDQGMIDSGCSRRMTGNMSYLTNFEEIDGGYVAFGGNQSNGNAGTKACDDASKARMETVPGKDYILLPLWPADLPFSQNSKSSPDARFKPSGDNEKKVTEEPGKEGGDLSNKNDSVNSTNNINTTSDGNSTNNVNTVSSTVNTTGIEVNAVGTNASIELPNDLNMPELEDIMYSGLWYLKDSPFDLVAYTNSDYAGASLDRKSTTGGCQFLRCRLISWQCKKHIVVAQSTIKAEFSNCFKYDTERSHITLENVHDAKVFDVNDLDGDEVVVESEVPDKADEKRNIVEKHYCKVKVQRIVGKAEGGGKMIEPEKPLKKKDQIKFDEEEALRLQAKFDEEDRLAREKVHI
ncbi:hypothetical protein Tco_0349045 [Tanacetum coccineum]